MVVTWRHGLRDEHEPCCGDGYDRGGVKWHLELSIAPSGAHLLLHCHCHDVAPIATQNA